MASEWAGFSDEDLKKLRSETLLQDPTTLEQRNITSHNVVLVKGKLAGTKKSRNNVSTRCSSSSVSNEVLSDKTCDTVTDSADLLTEVSKSALEESLTDNNCENMNVSMCVESKSEPIKLQSEDDSKVMVAVGVQNEDVEIRMQNGEFSTHAENESASRILKASGHLETFEQRQKQMEVENARRKALIAKALQDRKRKTEAETKKLEIIQKELNRLDNVLSVDVSALRDLIEDATIKFSGAHKRYLKAEKEFVTAKTFLFEMMDRKEKLTEHLCTIIEQAEVRKANRLNELMHQLELEPDIFEDTERNGSLSILPTLCSLNDTSYCNCTTIKPPNPERNENVTDKGHQVNTSALEDNEPRD